MPIHKRLFYKKSNKEDLGVVYLCNWAVGGSLEKSSYRWKDVTCKNCLKQKGKKSK